MANSLNSAALARINMIMIIVSPIERGVKCSECVYVCGGKGSSELGWVQSRTKAGVTSRPPSVRFPRISILDRRHWGLSPLSLIAAEDSKILTMKDNESTCSLENRRKNEH